MFCVYFYLVVPCLRCCMCVFFNCSEWGLLSVVVCRLCIVVASLVVEHGL